MASEMTTYNASSYWLRELSERKARLAQALAVHEPERTIKDLEYRVHEAERNLASVQAHDREKWQRGIK